MSKVFSHYTVMKKECIDALDIRKDGCYVDCTTGGAGHSLAIFRQLGRGGKLFCFDKDGDARKVAQERLQACKEELSSPADFYLLAEDFAKIKTALHEEGIEKVDGVLADLGVSSFQLDEAERGFAYMQDGPLDMRMNQASGKRAADFVNEAKEEDLCRCFWEYGEERYARQISKGIVARRQYAPFETTQDLVNVILQSIPPKAKKEQQHPAKRVFQALRIYVNQELQALDSLLDSLPSLAQEGTKIVILSFHSLEDRRVKERFRTWQHPCTCPRHLPVCMCGKKSLGFAEGKSKTASEKELAENPRSRSARLRVFHFSM